MARLEEYYKETLVKELQETLGLENVMEVPRLTHITLNMGLGEAVGDKKVIEKAVEDMALISGQKPVVTMSRKSIAGFKIRDNLSLIHI